MTSHKPPVEQQRTEMIGIRVSAEQKRLIESAAAREGLQVASFIIMLLVRVHILPVSCLRKLKRRPVPFFNELHALLGTINLIGGNSKQLASVMPDLSGLRSAHGSIIRAANAVMDAIQGKPLPEGVNIYRFEGRLTIIGYNFNDIVRSVNMGRPQLSGMRAVLTDIAETSDAITAALTGRTIQNPDMAYVKNLAERAREEVRASMKQAAKKHTGRNKGSA